MNTYIHTAVLLLVGLFLSSELIAQPSNRDSLLDIEIEEAKNQDEILLLKAYHAYFNVADITDEQKWQERAAQALAKAKETNDDRWYYTGYSALAKLYLTRQQPAIALDHVGKAYYHVSLIEDEGLKSSCMMLYGKCQERNNNKIEAFRNYMNALYLAEKLGDNNLILQAYDDLADFFLFLKNYDRAEFYRRKQYKLIINNDHVDSLKIMDLNIKLSLILLYGKHIIEAKKITTQTLDYVVRNKREDLFNRQMNVYRSYLIEQNDFKGLADLYTKQYPAELDKLARTDTTLYFRVKAYIAEAEGYIDSAYIYNERAETGLLKENKDHIFLSNFFRRYGQFYLRRGQIKPAIEKMQKAYTYAEQAQYMPYLVETTGYLDSLYYTIDDIAKAYEYSKLNKDYIAKQDDINREDEILLLEIDNETKKQELYRRREQEATGRRHSLQYMGMAVGIAGCFVLLAMFGRLKVNRLVIKSLGFFSFIFFFEFIVLLADTWIHHATHGEPWKIMSIKVVLIGIIFPLHHWLEEKVIHYLTERQLMSSKKPAHVGGSKKRGRKTRTKTNEIDSSLN